MKVDDLEYREERKELKQPIKKNIPLKLKIRSFEQTNEATNVNVNVNNINNNNVNANCGTNQSQNFAESYENEEASSRNIAPQVLSQDFNKGRVFLFSNIFFYQIFQLNINFFLIVQRLFNQKAASYFKFKLELASLLNTNYEKS